MSISKRSSYVDYDKLTNKYYFILPDGSDREIDDIFLMQNINWTDIYRKMYKYKLENDIDNFDDIDIYDIVSFFK